MTDQRAILTPLIDTICCGGASVVLVGGALIVGTQMPADWGQTIDDADILLANVLINWPHFMASYRILYRTRKSTIAHPWVSLVLPALFLFLIGYALATADQNAPEQAGLANQTMIDVAFPLGVLLLAWHYTGQSWGMTATFLYLAGAKLDAWDRRLIRSGYRALLVFHILWVVFTRDTLQIIDMLLPGAALLIGIAYTLWWWVLLATFVAGLIGFWRVARRSGRPPPVRAWLPWVATFLWYVLVDRHPGMFFMLQLSHALQYLIFPLRVEMNQYGEQHHTDRAVQRRHAFWYYLLLVLTGWAAFEGLKLVTTKSDPLGLLALLIGLLINIHHYFIDGVIWKIRDPAVKHRLFGHLAGE